jgi:hypothetical protein
LFAAMDASGRWCGRRRAKVEDAKSFVQTNA